MTIAPHHAFRQTITASTEGLQGQEKFDFWYDLCRSTLASVRCEPVRGTDFNASLAGVTMARSSAIRIEFSPHLVTVKDIAEEDVGAGCINVVTSGELVLMQDGREVLLRPGDGAFVSLRPLTMRTEQPCSMASVKFSKGMWRGAAGTEEKFTARSLASFGPTGAMLCRLVDEFVQGATVLDNNVVDRLSDVCADMLDVCHEIFLGREGGALPTHIGLTLFRAKRFISENIAAPDMSSEQVARALKLSARYLNRLFETEGTSLARYIWGERLKHAARVLESPARRKLSISTIAYEAGFKNPSHFSYAFHERFGMSPSDYRKWSLTNGVISGGSSPRSTLT